MLIPIRTLSKQDAEVLARSVETRTLVGGLVECHGLSWKTDALHDWENTERGLNREPRVEVLIDELDLHVVYINSPQGGGAIKLDSRQPEFTRGLSLFELNRLKKVVKDKALAERLGRMSDSEALGLRIEWYARLGHGDDPVAQKRLSDLQDELARLRLRRAGMSADPGPTPSPAPADREATTPSKPPSKKKDNSKGGKRVPEPLTPPPATPPQSPQSPSPDPQPTPAAPPTPPHTDHKPGALPTPKFPSLNLKRRPV